MSAKKIYLEPSGAASGYNLITRPQSNGIPASPYEVELWLMYKEMEQKYLELLSITRITKSGSVRSKEPTR